MLKRSFLLLSVFVSSLVLAQEEFEELYPNSMGMFKWEEERGLINVDTTDLKEQAVVLLDEHKYVFSGVENAISNLRVRCISADGKIVNFD